MSILGGLFTTLGAVSQSRAASAQASLSQQAAEINRSFLMDDAQLARDRNERFARAIDARVAAAFSERGLVSTSGSASDIRRANTITENINRSIIERNLARSGTTLGIGLSGELMEARQRRRLARVQAIAGIAEIAESGTRLAAGGIQ